MENNTDTQKCPYCAETIKAEAIVCRHCGRDLATGKVPDLSISQNKKSNPALAIILLVIVLFGIYILYTAIAPVIVKTPSQTNPQAPQTAVSRTVIYKIEGATAKKISLTYQTADGSTQQEEVPTGWAKELKMSRGTFAYLSAQLNTDGGRVSCLITIDGKSFKQAESSGSFAIVSCSGVIP